MSQKQQLAELVKKAFIDAGFDPIYGEVLPSNRRDLAQFQCNGALAAAKQYGKSPREISQAVVARLKQQSIFDRVDVAGPGFINIVLSDEFLTNYLRSMGADEYLGCTRVMNPRKFVIDYGGANIAKPMHVGHLRSAIIGEGIKRLLRFKGHQIVGDIHLGDWGLPMGMVIAELQHRYPALSYFDDSYHGPYPSESPVMIDDLEEIYPAASRHAQQDDNFLQAARRATAELQNGRPGYRALWQQFVEVSVTELKKDYAGLHVEFDLWLGESDAQERIEPLVEQLYTQGFAYESRGAVVVDVSLPGDAHEIPPLILVKSDGAVLYGTTDLATVQMRVQKLQADVMLYVVDKRQSTHFEQVFRAARKTGIAPNVAFKHIGFGTMNDKDGKPFKTRAGGVLKLRTLLQMVTDRAKDKLNTAKTGEELSDSERDEIARKVGVAALKFADLSNHYSADYVFDLDRFLQLEGRTGPYLLYTVIRAKSILHKSEELIMSPALLQEPASEAERELLLKLAELHDVLDEALENYTLNTLCEYAYELSAHYNHFYHQHHILTEADSSKQQSWLYLSALFVRTLELILNILGIEVPQRM